MQKKFYTYLCAGLLALMAIPYVQAYKNPCSSTSSEKLDRVLQSMQTVVEKQVVRKKRHSLAPKHNYNPLTPFYQGVGNACCDFASIENEVTAGAFAGHEAVHKNFQTLCDTITKIDSVLHKPENLRPRHIRWFQDAVRQFAKAASAIEKKVRNQEDLQLIHRIQDFTRIMNRDVFPHCARYVGTGFEHLRDFLIHRPAEFLKRNWWWTIPVAVAGTKITWDTITFAENQKQDPKDWNLKTNDQPNSSCYTKLLSLLAGGFFAAKFKDGYTKMDGHTFVGAPIGTEYPAEQLQAEYKQYRRELERDENGLVIGDPRQVAIEPFQFDRHYNQRIITQLPAVTQSGCDCGLHSLYNAVCLATGRYADLVNRQKFEQHLRAWKNHVYQAEAAQKGVRPTSISRFLGTSELETLIQNFPFFARIRRNQRQRLENQLFGGAAVYNYLQNNVSVIFDLNGLEGIFRNRNQNDLAPILGAAAGGHNHTLWNIDRFRNHNAHRQVIIVNDGHMVNGFARGSHWFAIVIEYDQATNTDHIIITESMSEDYRKQEIIKRVYRLFRTDRLNDLNAITFLMAQPVNG